MNKKKFILFSLLAALQACSLMTAPEAPVKPVEHQPAKTATQPTIQAEAQTAPMTAALTQPASPAPSQNHPSGKPGSPCGNGVCSGPENAQNCPADCSGGQGSSQTPGFGGPSVPQSPGSGQSAAANLTEYTATNPSSGAALYIGVAFPASWDKQSALPALVLVPGGSGDSSHFTGRKGPAGSTVDTLTQAGFAVVIFDPDGRGKSGGAEDYNGFIHQDGLAEVIRFAAALTGIDPQRIGLVTYSYGITMGSGALARHPDLPVRFLIDWEGPANRDDTGGCDGAGLGHLKQVASCSDEAFWAQREASTFIAQIRVPYQRVQSEQDHVQPDNSHAILMVNNAVNGGSPWVRLNNETPNQVFDPNAPPAMLPDSMDRQTDALIAQYAQELFAR